MIGVTVPTIRGVLCLIIGSLLFGHLSVNAVCPNDADYELRVFVQDGKVPDTDIWGKTDALVFITVDGVSRQTDWDEETLEPEWNEWLKFGCVNKSSPMLIDVWDYDGSSLDDVFSSTWETWSTYYEGVVKRIYDSSETYWVDLKVNYTNYTQEHGGAPSAAPTQFTPTPTVPLTTLSPTTFEEYCGSNYVPDCDGSGDCCPEWWIGDGVADCATQPWDCDLSCYDYDGGDCAPTLAPTYTVAPTYSLAPTIAPTHVPTTPAPSPQPTPRPTPLPTPVHHHHHSDDDTMSAGAAVGLTFGLLIGVAALGGGGYYYYKKRQGGGGASYGFAATSEYSQDIPSRKPAIGSPLHLNEDDDSLTKAQSGTGYQPPALLADPRDDSV